MVREIKKAAVFGAGTMGSRIAAHLANAGVPCLLLDLPGEGASRNAVAEKALKGLLKSRPPAFFTPGAARLIETGNFEDDLERAAGADWIIEAIVERMEPKRELLARVDRIRKPGSLCSSNTSGLPIARLCEGLSEDLRRHWMGTHFFNPPRHMRLVELIPGPDASPEAVRFAAGFCDRRLGKVVVYAKDRPNFIANRIFLFSVMHTIEAMQKFGLTVEEVDALTGPLIGRPRMATFRLADFTGIDVCLYVAKTLYDMVPDDEKREVYKPPKFLEEMVARGVLGDKAGQGFYKKDKSAPGGRLVLDLEKMDYREPRPPSWPVLKEAQQTRDPAGRIGKLIASEEVPGKFLWETLSELFLYAAGRIPEVADDVVSVDTTMRAGFNWEFGIFEIWSRLGVEKTAERMQAEGRRIPPLVRKVLDSPEKTFYQEREGELTFFDLDSGAHKVLQDPPGVLRLSTVKRKKGIIKQGKGARLLDLGEGVVCLEFTSKANTLDADVLERLAETIPELESNYEALVIGNEGQNFCVGANLGMLLELARAGRFEDIAKAVDQTQSLFRALRDSSKPVVAAVFSQTLAGGCELALHAGRVQAAAETYIGLVEAGAGLIPAAGGCKELLRRNTAGLTPADDLIAPTRAAFEKIGMAKVANSAAEAREWRFLRPVDGVTMNRERLLADAKKTALALAGADYRPPAATEVLAGGRAALAAMKLDLYLMQEAAYISAHDAHIGRKLAETLSGGDLTQPAFVSEEYLLGLEKEAFLSLCGEEKTQQRMDHLLKTGKPLRN